MTWRKSSYSAASSDCLEVNVTEKIVYLRDSKNTDWPPLVIDRETWREFVDGVKDGEFD